MRVQRTRGLVAAQALRFAGIRSAVQDLSGGRSPLTRQPLDGMMRPATLSRS